MVAVSRAPISVLLVDDDPALLRAVARALRDPELEVLTAGSAPEALEVLRRRPIDVLVSDIDMPGVSGLELIAIVRREFPATVRMLLTGAATSDRAIEAINEGEVARFLVKPFERDLFRAVLLGVRERIERGRDEALERTRRAQQDALFGWVESNFPGTTTVRRSAIGELVVDPGAIDLLLERLRG